MKPNKVNILGIEYKIVYVDNPALVDFNRRESLWGQIDYWTRTIRIFDDGKRPDEDIWQTIIHETLHAITEQLHLREFTKAERHDDLDLIALAITDIFFRNGWFSSKEQ